MFKKSIFALCLLALATMAAPAPAEVQSQAISKSLTECTVIFQVYGLPLAVIFFINLHRLVYIVGCYAVLFLTATEKWHESGVDLLFLLVDVDRNWHLNHHIFFNIDRYFFDYFL